MHQSIKCTSHEGLPVSVLILKCFIGMKMLFYQSNTLTPTKKYKMHDIKERTKQTKEKQDIKILM